MALILFLSSKAMWERAYYFVISHISHYKPPNHLEESVNTLGVMCAMMILQMSYELVFTGYRVFLQDVCFLLPVMDC